ncbi:hypothetical protein [Leadbetterella byssophila]|jgi:hypothetical protein|uniref:hypothetical protein n=1 Tax=Leadbetterella byssophila TaxID=316068 RepID=UPI0039A20A35
MKRTLFLAFFLLSLATQAQEFKTVEELLEKSDPKAFKAMTSKNPFIVVSNYRNGKRWKYFEGDILRFKTKEGKYFEEEIAYIEDSTFTIYKYNSIAQRMEQYAFKPSDIKSVYKYKRGGVWKTALLSMSPIVPMALIDWGVYNTPPWENENFLWITPIIGVGNVIIFKHKNFFNQQRMGENRTFRIIRPY